MSNKLQAFLQTDVSLAIYKSSRAQVSFHKMLILKISQSSQENLFARVSY